MKLFLLIILFSFQAHALIPLESLKNSNGKDLFNYNLFEGMYSNQVVYKKDKTFATHSEKFFKYQTLYNQGMSLKFSCEYQGSYFYANVWEEANARRSVASTLQYIGLDLTLKAIVKYSKLMDLSSTEYNNVVENLLHNSCSPNITTMSIKLLRQKFLYYYNNDMNDIDFELPSVKGNPFFSQNFKELTSSFQAKEKEFNLSLKNFRSFCSWGGDTDDYRMLAPYLANPYVMSVVFNHLNQKETLWDQELQKIFFQKKKDSIRVACDDLLCREMNESNFNRLFPRMIGSTRLHEDLENLYCGHFRNQTYHTNNSNEKVKKWINEQKIEDPYLETFQFLSLNTGVPDLLIALDNYQAIPKEMLTAIDLKWQKWAQAKSEQLVSDLFYEEPLEINMLSMSLSEDVRKGEFGLVFNYSLGELDRVLNLVDKVHATFYLEFPRSYLKWLRKAYLVANNQSRYEEKEALIVKASEYIKVQLAKKEKIFLIPMWNQEMPMIMARELIAQLSNYNGTTFKELGNDKFKIPVKLRYGLFALKYLRNRFQEKYRSKSLTSGP